MGQVPKTTGVGVLNDSRSEGVGRPLTALSEENYSISILKKRFRHEFSAARSSLSQSEVNKASERIANLLIELPAYKSAQSIGLYFPIKNEVDTCSIFKNATATGKDVYYPRVDGHLLSFHEVNRVESLKTGTFWVPEPNENSPAISTEDLDLLIIPGLVFNLAGGRIGYGKGFYDRSAKFVKLEKRIALAYSFQIQNSIPVSTSDADIGYLITELGIFSCAVRSGGA